MSEKDMYSQDYSELVALAESSAGQRLLELLQKNNEKELQDAMNQAMSGDYSTAKRIIEQFLATPEASSLVEELRR